MRRSVSIAVLVLGAIALTAGPASAFSYNQPPTDFTGKSPGPWAGYTFESCLQMYYLANEPPGGTQSLKGFYFNTSTADLCPTTYQIMAFPALDGSSTLTVFVAPGAHLLIGQPQLRDMGYYGFEFNSYGGGQAPIWADPCTAWDHPANFIVTGDQVLAANCPAG